MRKTILVAVAPVLVTVGGLLAPGLAQAAAACDRACLEAFVDQYLDAVVAHEPRRLPFAKNAKFTENGQTLELGDGAWRTITAKGTYRMFVTDVEAGSVAFLGSIKEADTPAMLGLRMKIRKGQIAEARDAIQRSDKSADGFDKIGYTWQEPIPPAERMSRADLVRVANMYFSGMQQNDGKGDYPVRRRLQPHRERPEQHERADTRRPEPGRTRRPRELFRPVGLQGAVQVRPPALRHAHPRPALRGRGP